MAKPIRKLVQLVLDRRAARKTEADTKKALKNVDRGFQKLRASAVKMGAAIGAALGVRKLIQFGKESLKVAAESDAIWTRLGHAIETAGYNATVAIPEVQRMARAMQDVTTVGDEDFAEILTELITVSGDYRRSLREIGTVANLAAAKQIDLRTAAQLVGRAMIGETATLKRYGVIVEEGGDAMEVLRRQFAGFAESEARSLQGQLKQLNNEWSDFKQAIGEAISAGADGESMLDRLTEKVKGLTRAVSIYFGVWGDAVQADWVSVAETVVGQEADVDRALARLAIVEAETRRKLAAAQARLDDLLRPSRRFMRWFIATTDNNKQALKEAEQAVEAYTRALGQMKTLAEGIRSGTVSPGGLLGAGTPTPQTQLSGKETGPPWERFSEQAVYLQEWSNWIMTAETSFGRLVDQSDGLASLNQEMEVSAQNAALLADMMGQAGDQTELTQKEVETLNRIGAATGAVMAGIFAGNIGEMAKWKAEQNAIMAAEHLAMAAAAALIPGIGSMTAGKHLATAAQFAAISAAWGALAGATGGFSGGGGGGGGGATTPRDTGGRASERAEGVGAEVHIHFVGAGFNAVNPEVQRIVYDAQSYAEERFGSNATVKVHRRNRK